MIKIAKIHNLCINVDVLQVIIGFKPIVAAITISRLLAFIDTIDYLAILSDA